MKDLEYPDISGNTSPPPSRSMNRRIIPAAAGIAYAAPFLFFIPSLFNEFVMTWDDGYFIAFNRNIQSFSLSTVIWAFTEFRMDDWMPLVWISFALDHAIWGANPVGSHLTNNLLHSLNSALFFLIARHIFDRVDPDGGQTPLLWGIGKNIYASLLASLFFALHPLRVESVAWASQRKDVLCFFFGLISILFYLRHAGSGEPGQGRARFIASPLYWASFATYFLSLASKPMLVTLPLIFLILDRFPLGRLDRKSAPALLLEKTPFILLAGVISLLITRLHTSSLFSLAVIDIPSRILIACKSVVTYLLLMVWPAELSPFHLHPLNVSSQITLDYILPVAAVIIITAACSLLAYRTPPVWLAAWLIYLVTLLPVLGFVQANLVSMADRYTYIASLPVTLLAAAGAAALVEHFSPHGAVRAALTAGYALIALVLGFLTIKQTGYWKDDVTLWSRAIELKPGFSGKMYSERAAAFEMRGDFASALRDIDEAIAIATRKNVANIESLYFRRTAIIARLNAPAGSAPIGGHIPPQPAPPR